MEDYLNYFEREAVPAAMQALRDLSAYPNATGYLQPTLAQLCAFTLPPAALYEGPNALAESNPAVALHALMARAVRSSLTATYLTVLDEYWNDLEDNPEHNGYFEEGLVLLEQVARNVVCNREFAAHLRHPHAVKLCERWLQQGVMNRFVNGGTHTHKKERGGARARRDAVLLTLRHGQGRWTRRSCASATFSTRCTSSTCGS